MAKKFAVIKGFNKVYKYNYINGVGEYNIQTPVSTSFQSQIDKNTICFIIADSSDAGKKVGDFTIKENDKFIVTQNNIFAYTEKPTEDKNTWRPIYINGNEILKDSTTTKPINFSSSNTQDGYLTFDYKDEVDDYLNVYCDLDEEKLEAFIKENITVNDGKLNVTLNKTTIKTSAGEDKEIKQNTILINKNTSGTNEIFTANQSTDKDLKITYTGKADKADWFVENNSNNDNNLTGKKFVYLDSFNKYFLTTNFPNVSSLNDDGKKIISENTIVFITCDKNDETVFDSSEFQNGARFMWINGKLFSSNTWGPLYVSGFHSGDTVETEKSINPIIGYKGKNYNSGKITLKGGGGIQLKITHSQDSSDSTITIDGSGIQGGTGSTEISLDGGDATKITKTSDSKTTKVNFVREPTTTSVSEPGSDIPSTINNKTYGENNPNDVATTESAYDSKKNFLKIHQDSNYTWAEVNGIDSDAIYFSGRIPFGNSALSELVLDDIIKNAGGTKTGEKGNWQVTNNDILENYTGAGKTKDNLYIKQGVTLQKFLESIMHNDISDSLPSFILLSELDYNTKTKDDTITQSRLIKNNSFGDIDFSKDKQAITINDKTVNVYIGKYDKIPSTIKPLSILSDKGATQNLYEIILCVPAQDVIAGKFLKVEDLGSNDITVCPSSLPTMDYNYLTGNISINGDDYRIWYRYYKISNIFDDKEQYSVNINYK